MSKKCNKALIALGSNVTSQFGSPKETVEKALAVLNEGGIRLRERSPLYLTAFVPAGEGADVVNAAARIEVEMGPEALLARLHQIEAQFARSRRARWVDRTLDLDLIAYEDLVSPDRESVLRWMRLAPERQKRQAPDGLILPHPRLQERAFVLVPAADVWPEWRHPLTGHTIREMCDSLPARDLTDIKRLPGSWAGRHG